MSDSPKSHQYASEDAYHEALSDWCAYDPDVRREIQAACDELEREGKIVRVDGGYRVVTDKA